MRQVPSAGPGGCLELVDLTAASECSADLHGALVLAVVVAAVVGLGVLLFTRRDLD